MFTGRRPTDEMFKDDFNLCNFVKMALPERLVEVVDSSLLLKEEETTASTRRRNYINNRCIECFEPEEGNVSFQNPSHISLKCLVSILEIGLACSDESPNERMSMED
ncbi:hypothetical protein TorRG33x02_355980, partial [Trema orientale]